MILPEFVTFTGLDQRTDMRVVDRIAAAYPTEWGVLFSGKRSGMEPRYPLLDVVEGFKDRGLRLAAHLCGNYARNALMGVGLDWLAEVLDGFDRVQVNYVPNAAIVSELREPTATGLGWGHWEVQRLADHLGKQVIVQHRSAKAWPPTANFTSVGKHYVKFLYDLSGGRGAAPAKWPQHPGGDTLVGYAGGLGPENVLEVLAKIGCDGPYWIDMEGNVRTEDWFDLQKVESVCAQIYGSRPQN